MNVIRFLSINLVMQPEFINSVFVFSAGLASIKAFTLYTGFWHRIWYIISIKPKGKSFRYKMKIFTKTIKKKVNFELT